MNNEKRSYVFLMISFIFLTIIVTAALTYSFIIVGNYITDVISRIILRVLLVITELYSVTGLIWAAVEITEMHKKREKSKKIEKNRAKLGGQKDSSNRLTTVKFYPFDDRFLEIDCGTWYYEIQCRVSSKHQKLNKVLYKWMKKIDEKNEKKAKKVKKTTLN